MSSSATPLDLQGVVRYTLISPNEIQAKWMSSRMVDRFSEPGNGHAKRIVQEDSTSTESWCGVWEISYFEPDGKLAVTPFILKLERNEQVFHGTWALPTSPDEPVLSGFGFEDEDGKLCMRYGS